MQIERDAARRSAEAIGGAVRRARVSLDLRQDELAVAAGVSTRAIHQIEHGKPTSRLDTLASVLEVLGLELAAVEQGGSQQPPQGP